MIDVPMPQLGESVAEGTVTKWLVKEGEFVEREQILLEVATDKTDTEVTAPSAGRVTKIAAEEGTIVANGGLLCQIDETASQSDETATGEASAGGSGNGSSSSEQASGGQASGGQASGGQSAPAQPPPPKNPEQAAGVSPPAAPSTRQLARDHGVDMRGIKATGEHGRATREDVMRAASAEPPTTGSYAPDPLAPGRMQPGAQPAPPAHATPAARELSQMMQSGGGFVPPIPGVGFGSYKVPPYIARPGDEVVPFSRRRRITADHMVYSKITSPHVVTVAEVDLHATSLLRNKHKDRLKKQGVPLTFLAFICAAVVKALREHPELNSRLLDNSYVKLRDINLGVAVDTPGGLIVPNIKQADQLSLRGIASSIDELATKARSGKISADDLSGTSFSVSNPGRKGNLFGGAIISQPNVGILRVGEIKKRVVVVERDGEDSIAIHPVMFVALSYDHRVVDGVFANSFLWRVADLLATGDFEVG